MSRWDWQQDRGMLAVAIEEPPVEEATDAEGYQGPDLDLVLSVHQRLIASIDPKKLNALPPDEAREAVFAAARQILAELYPAVVGEARDQSLEAIADEVLGLGPIERLVQNPRISEVMVNAPDLVYWEERGIIYRSGVRFRDADHVMRIIQRIVAPLGRRVDESSPYVDARLPDGSRVNVIIPPIAYKSPVITIRKFLGDKYTMGELIAVGTLSAGIADFLAKAVTAKLNILISGGTGTGKTTLLNALAAHIPDGDRLIVIEETAEIHLDKPNLLRFEARRAQAPLGQEAPLPPVTIADLLRATLRHRPDRILVGEVRGAEAFDLLQALNTGHLGSLTTIHANSAEQALTRLAHCVLTANVGLPHRSIREAIALAVHLIVHVARVHGQRRVTELVAVKAYDGHQDRFVLESHLEGDHMREGVSV